MKTFYFIDGAYLINCLKQRFVLESEGRSLASNLHSWFCGRLLELASKAVNEHLSVVRIHYYDCYPYKEELVHPLTKVCYKQNLEHRVSFLDTMGTLPKVMFKPGTLIFNGWKANFPERRLASRPTVTDRDVAPDIRQKRVDVQIAMDVMNVLHRQTPSCMLFVTNDSDFAPVLQQAQELGVTVFLCNMSGRRGVTSSLSHAADYILNIANRDIPFLKLKKACKATLPVFDSSEESSLTSGSFASDPFGLNDTHVAEIATEPTYLDLLSRKNKK